MPTHDEYDSTSRRGSAQEVLVPLLVLAAALALAYCASVKGALAGAWSLVFTLAEKNQILQAFIASSLLGLLSYALMACSRTCLSWLRGRTFCSITIQNKDESFEKVIDFIGKQGIVSSGCLVASTYQKKKTWKDWRTEFLMGERNPPRMNYAPANNNDVHVIHYAGARILMHRHKGETVVAGWERVPMQMETLTLSSFGSRIQPLKRLIDDALKASFEEQQDELTVFVLNGMWGGSWEKALSKKPRSIDSVILDEDLADGLLHDARGFLQSAEWYASVGIPYRRGYLLYGPPGCGKTSFCQALAGALKLDICMLTLTNKNLNDNSLAESLRDAPANAIVLLEDVDAVFVDRKQADSGSSMGVTFSGLLNALDGVGSQEGRLFFMTTNHIEKLDPALIRPGRCDVKVEVRRASRQQARQLFSRFFVERAEADAVAFAEALPEYELSMATLQGYLLEHKADADGALAHVQRLLRSSKPMHVERMPIFDHLRRVGLEGWAPLFAYHGYELKSDLRGLTIETVKQWSGYLRIDMLACKRLELLLAEDAKLMEEYQLIDMATAKELFLAVFATATDVDARPVKLGGDESPTEQIVELVPELASPSRQSSAELLQRAAQQLTEREPLSKLADRLCSTLQVDGKSVVSIWQVRQHLHLHGHSPEEACAAAANLATPSPPHGCNALGVDELSTYNWLRRVGLEKHAAALEDAGYATARSLYGLAESTLKDDCGVRDRTTLKRLSALLNAEQSAARTLLSFTTPNYARLRSSFVGAFATAPDLAEKHASAFASSLCDGGSHGRISLHQLEAYLAGVGDRHKGPAEAARAAKAELVDHVRPEAPPVAKAHTPTDWVYVWLKEHGLDGYWSCLEGARFKEKADLLLEPRLSLEELGTLGVDKLAEARKLFNLIKAL